jgi:hypothetical protein
MTTSANDISVVLSGGTTNINPSLSLGGDPSSSPISSGSLNNLFLDIAADRDEDKENYRCLYIFNDGDTAIYNMNVYVEQQSNEGSVMEIGILEKNESQRIIINGTITGGNLILQYTNKTFTWSHNSNLGLWANNLQVALENLTNSTNNKKFFRSVAVTAQQTSSNQRVFDIKWSGKDAKRNFETIFVTKNSQNQEIGNLLEPLGTIAVSTSVSQQGYPINTIANEIDSENTPPGNVGFFRASSISPVVIPRLDPEEGFPLWVKRFTPQEASARENDGFSLMITAQSLDK